MYKALMNRHLFLYLIIILEGYAVLSTELLAIRQTLPFVGSGTDTLSIIIAAVLMPLAFGYYAGGRYKKNIRKTILRNIVIAQIILVPALSYAFLSQFFEPLIGDIGFKNRIGLTTLYCVVFLLLPIYLLGQTVPLISNFFKKQRFSSVAGKILFFSTLGSCFGAVLTTTVLMNTIGVGYTAVITLTSLSAVIILLSKKKVSALVLFSLLSLGVSIFLNSSWSLEKINIVAHNAYSTVQIEEVGNKNVVRFMRLNRSYSSAISLSNKERPVFEYAKHIDRYYLKGLKRAGIKGNILILGAGGFTIGKGDKWNTYTYVDVDPNLQEIAEKEFLKTKLAGNKKFLGLPARAYLIQSKEKYDLIIMDIYKGPSGIPEHLLTQEFFRLLETKLKDKGVILMHLAASSLFEDEYSKALDNTIKSVYPYASRQSFGGFIPWALKNTSSIYDPQAKLENDSKKRKNLEKGYQSILYQIRPKNQSPSSIIFTDNLNKVGKILSPDIPY